MQIRVIFTTQKIKIGFPTGVKFTARTENYLSNTTQRYFSTTENSQKMPARSTRSEKSLFDTSRPIYNSHAEWVAAINKQINDINAEIAMDERNEKVALITSSTTSELLDTEAFSIFNASKNPVITKLVLSETKQDEEDVLANNQKVFSTLTKVAAASNIMREHNPKKLHRRRVELLLNDKITIENRQKQKNNFFVTYSTTKVRQLITKKIFCTVPRRNVFIRKRALRRGYFDWKRERWTVRPRWRKRVKLIPIRVNRNQVNRNALSYVNRRGTIKWQWPNLKVGSLDKDDLKFEYTTRHYTFHKNKEFRKHPFARISFREQIRPRPSSDKFIASGAEIDSPRISRRLLDRRFKKILIPLGKIKRQPRIDYIKKYKQIIKKHGFRVPLEVNHRWVRKTRHWIPGHLSRKKDKWKEEKKQLKKKDPDLFKKLLKKWLKEGYPDRKLLYPPAPWDTRLTIERLEILGENQNIAEKWEVRPPNYFDRGENRARRHRKEGSNRTLNPTRYRQRLQPMTVKQSIWKQIRKQQVATVRNIKNRQPHYGLIYRLLPRHWHSPRNAQGLPLARARLQQEIILKRQAINLRREEIGLWRKHWVDTDLRALEVRTGMPGALGYVRPRRVFRPRFNLNRWWRPQLNPTPQQHPINFLAYSSFTLKKAEKKQKFLSKYNWWAETALENLETGLIVSPTSEVSNAWAWSRIKAEIFTPAAKDSVWTYTNKNFIDIDLSVIRSAFIDQSANWLSERLVEKAALTLSHQDWVNFSKSTKEATDNNFSFTCNKFIEMSRRDLFTQHPNWWSEEAVRRIQILKSINFDRETNEVIINKDLTIDLSTAKQIVHIEKAVVSSSQILKQEQQIFEFIYNSLDEKQKKEYLLNQTSKLDLIDKEFRQLYQIWLKGNARRRKLTKNKLSSPIYNDEVVPYVTDLGTTIPRFRGRARRRRTFESALRSYYERTIRPVFRRIHGSRFKGLKPRIAPNQYKREIKFTLSALGQQQRRQAKRHNFVGYLNKSWRDVITLQKTKTSSVVAIPGDQLSQLENKTAEEYKLAGGTKGRFVSLPLKSVMRRYKKNRADLKPLAIKEAAGTVFRLIRRALNQRRVARRLRDLKKVVKRRKLPREQKLPSWIVAKLIRRRLRRRNKSKDLYPIPSFYRKKWENFWALSGVDLRITRSRPSRRTDYRPLRPHFIHNKTDHRRLFGIHGLTSTRYRVLKKTIPALWTKRWLKKLYDKNEANNERVKQFKPRLRRRSRREPKLKDYTTDKSLIATYSKRLLTNKQKSIRLDAALSRESALSNKNKNRVLNPRRRFWLTPLQFKRRTRDVVLSDGEIARNLADKRATRRENYRLLGERTEELTSFFPELIRWLIIKKFKNKHQTPEAIKKLIQTVYWSIRFHISHDKSGRRFAARDNNVLALKTLRQEILITAEERYFGRSEEDQMRYRFQPYKINRKRSQRIGLMHWYRRFLPKLFDLYREDPEKYHVLQLSVTDAYRGSLSIAHPSNWKTRVIAGRPESKFKNFIRTKALSSRFETALITTRREATPVGYGLGAGLIVYAKLTQRKNSFFSRNFSTVAETNQRESQKLMFSRLNHDLRFSVSDKRLLSFELYAKAQQLAKESTVRRAKANQTMSRHEGGVGTIDLRLLRIKSPRNQQYLTRSTLISNFTQQRENKRKHKERASAYSNTKQEGAGLRSRQYTAPFFTQINQTVSPTLNKFRSAIATRRSQNFIKCSAGILKSGNFRKIYPEPYASFKVPVWEKVRESEHPLTIFKDEIKPILESTQVVRSNRSILHSRNAKIRSIRFNLPPREARIVWENIMTKSSLRRVKYNRRWIAAQVARSDDPHYSKFTFAKRVKKIAVRRIQLPTIRAGRLFRNAGLNTTLNKRNLSIIKSPATVFRRSNNTIENPKKPDYRLGRAQYFKPTSTVEKMYRLVEIAKPKLWSSIKFDKSSGARTIILKKFHNTWFRVTGFRTKKDRLIKRWLMHTRRALKARNFKDITLESYKLSRIRIRKLEWREFDDRFERKDFKKKATKFHISERRKMPWLESLIYPRTFFRMQRGRYRRDQAPQEYKSKKWLQYFRKAFATTNPKSLYIKGRRWPKLRIANYRFHLPMFELRNSRAAQRRLIKVSRHRTRDSQFQQFMRVHGNRLDVTLILINIASNPFWARAIAPIGLVAINGKVIYDRDYRLQPGDIIRLNPQKIENFRAFFTPAKRKWEAPRLDRVTSAGMAKNFYYYHKIHTAVYDRFPRYDDIPRNSRLNSFLFTMFCHEAGRNRT